MAMGKRRRHAKQASMWGRPKICRAAAHPFYARLNQILEQHGFDGYVEGLCERFYADDGRPGLPPGRYFRLLLIGYFEGLDAERAIAWRAADSFALCEFNRLVLPEAPPDYSAISRTRRLPQLLSSEARPSDRASARVPPRFRSSPQSWVGLAEALQKADKPRWVQTAGRSSSLPATHRTRATTCGECGSDPARGIPGNEPFRVTSFDSATLAIDPRMSVTEIGVSGDRLVLPMRSVTGNVWMLDNVDK
jgi:hypothetical protein